MNFEMIVTTTNHTEQYDDIKSALYDAHHHMSDCFAETKHSVIQVKTVFDCNKWVLTCKGETVIIKRTVYI